MAPDVVTFALFLASQRPDPSVPVDPAVWPYYVAIGALSTAIVTMFGVIMKLNANYAAEVARIHQENKEAQEQRSERVASEFKEKDEKLYDVAVKMAGIVEQVTAAINGLTDQIKETRE